MKKIISVLTGLALVAGAAMADGITFGSWGRGLWNVAANSGDDVVTDMHQSWGGKAPRTGIGVSGSTENVGFAVDMHVNGDSVIKLADSEFKLAAPVITVGDNALIWVKPIEQIKIVAGKKGQNELRGDAAFGLWNWDRIGAVDKMRLEGWTFPDVFDGNGVAVIAYPVDGLTVGAGIPLSLNGTGATLENTYAHGANYAAAYAIDGIGTVKAAYMTKADGTSRDAKKDSTSYGVIAAAFDLTMVDGLYASVGAQIPTASVNEFDSTIVNAYARYSLDALAVHLAVGTKLNTKDNSKTDDSKYDGNLGFAIGAGADYSLDNGIGFFGDVRYANGVYMKNTSADKSDCLTLGLGVEKNFSNGKIGIAFEGATNGNGRYAYEDNAFAWEIPVKVEYLF
ncbi:hypothetical protein [uncultured Treponema sp.]|uniref:hypothetical protein n=1 Tax=uncultured Treponema sp. TaxID=162155 RepID=UPI0025846855|nr:hypothetical protein [uncultured Treponema sp.]